VGASLTLAAAAATVVGLAFSFPPTLGLPFADLAGACWNVTHDTCVCVCASNDLAGAPPEPSARRS
jgi:hypothetical protein